MISFVLNCDRRTPTIDAYMAPNNIPASTMTMIVMPTGAEPPIHKPTSAAPTAPT